MGADPAPHWSHEHTILTLIRELAEGRVCRGKGDAGEKKPWACGSKRSQWMYTEPYSEPQRSRVRRPNPSVSDTSAHFIKDGDTGMRTFPSQITFKEGAVKTEDVMVAGDLALETGTYGWTLQPKSGSEIKDKGKYLTAWKRQADGSWKVIRDIGNTDLPAASQNAPFSARR